MEQKTKSGFSLYVNSSESVQNAVLLREKKKKYRKILLIGLAILCIMTFLIYRYRTYRTMSSTKQISKEMSDSTQSFAYENGTICYNEDGISFLNSKGETEWNKTFSVRNPISSYCRDYIVIASKSGNEVKLLDDTGNMKSLTVSYPIIDAEVAEQGVIALMLQGDDGNYIELYDAAQEKLVSIKTTPTQNGYPMDIDVSSDGQNLVVSYLVVDGIETKSRIAFYNFGDEGKEKEDRLVAGFDFKDTVIPKVSYMGNSRVSAVGDNKLVLFKAGSKPSKKKEVEINESIKSIAVNEDYIALIVENKDSEEQYEARVYNRAGRQIMSHGFSYEFTKTTLGDGELLLIGSYHCSILNFAGHEMFSHDFDKRVLDISPTGKARRYLVSYESGMELISLR